MASMALGKNVIGRAVLELVTEDKDLAAGLDKAEGKTKAWGAGIGGIAKTAILGLAGVGIGIAVASIKAAADAQAVTAQTDAVLASTKSVAGVTREAVLDLSAALSSVIPIEDEVIQETQNMLLTFTNISSEVFPAATETALDMATALGTDAVGASVQLGKALNDPIAGVGALARVGVTFTEAQKASIKAMVEAGDTMGAQKLILGELATEFGGSARAAGTTFGGQLQIAQTQLGNVQEEIGNALIPALMGLLQAVMPAIKAFGVWLPGAIAVAQGFLKENEGTMKTLMEVFGTLAGAILPALGFAFNTLMPAVKAWVNVLASILKIAQQAAGAIGNLIGAISRLPGVQGIVSGFGNIGGMLGFASGGVVPGPIGMPQLAVVHGGETVVPRDGFTGGAGHGHAIILDGQQVARTMGNRMQQRSFLAGNALG